MQHVWLLNLAAAAIPAFFFKPNVRAAANLFAAIVMVLVYQPILVLAPSALGAEQFALCLPPLVISMAIIAAASSWSIAWSLPAGPRLFWGLLTVATFLIVGALVVQALDSGLRLVSILNVAEARAGLSVSRPALYAIHIWTFAVGPLWITILLYRSKYWNLILVLLPFLLSYLITFQVTTIYAPIWVLAAFFSGNFIHRYGVVGAVLFCSAPIMCLSLLPILANIFGYADQRYLIDVYGAYFGFRLYGVHGQIFANYVDFFSTHPHTWFSHVTGINKFVRYPYDVDLPVLIGMNYPGGNQNTNFWGQDAVAGAGLWAMPAVSLVFGGILLAVNTVCRGLAAPFVVGAISMAALRFADSTIPTSLVTGGLALLLVLLAFAPRGMFGEASWPRARSAGPGGLSTAQPAQPYQNRALASVICTGFDGPLPIRFNIKSSSSGPSSMG